MDGSDKPGNTAVQLVKYVVGGTGYVLLDHNHPAVFAYALGAPLQIGHQRHVSQMAYTPLTFIDLLARHNSLPCRKEGSLPDQPVGAILGHPLL